MCEFKLGFLSYIKKEKKKDKLLVLCMGFKKAYAFSINELVPTFFFLY